jgi:hypothetical protein
MRQQLPTVEEQGICIGQTFLVAASNGRDPSRRVHVLGFCRSVQLVSEVPSTNETPCCCVKWQALTGFTALQAAVAVQKQGTCLHSVLRWL